MAQAQVNPIEKMNAQAEQKQIDKHQQETAKALKDKAGLDAMASSFDKVERLPDGTPNFSKMTPGQRTTFATEVARAMVGGRLTNFEEQKAFGMQPFLDSLKGYVNGNEDERKYAMDAIKSKLTGQTVNEGQMKNLYELYMGKRQSLGQSLQDINDRYAREGGATTNTPYETWQKYYDKASNIDRYPSPNKQQPHGQQPIQSGTPQPSNVKVYNGGWSEFDKQGKVE
jgi:hypothetical protein